MIEYRNMPNGRTISNIGIGAVHWHEIDAKETGTIIDFAEAHGLNLLDFAMAYDTPMPILGKTLAHRREKFVYQMHLGLTFPDGQYERTRNVSQARTAFEKQLGMLGTDYADTGFIHCVDEGEDFAAVYFMGLYDYARNLKEKGVIKQLGFATHTIDIAEKFLAAGGFDMCLFSINPAYDIAAVHKYLDLHGVGNDLAKEHYLGLTKKADDCTRCGACEQRCPFGVKVTEKMLSARERFNARK